jgi:hypothetical protein
VVSLLALDWFTLYVSSQKKRKKTGKKKHKELYLDHLFVCSVASSTTVMSDDDEREHDDTIRSVIC